ncbi:MAG: hypothetical protein IJS62_00320 [Bacteroidales bacterium]|nr:hypothetical protein [Bacteroidales bacterium]
MSRLFRVLLTAAASLLLLFLLLLGAVQLFLGSGKADALVAKLLRENIDARVTYADLHVSVLKRFPRISLRLDSLDITYPHTRYAAFDRAAVRSRLLDAGRSEESDTLLHLGSLRFSLNPWPLLAGRLRVRYALLEDLRLYAHAYDDSTANWQVLPPSEKKSSSLPSVSLGFLSLKGRNALVYTAQRDTVFIAGALRSLEASSDFHVGGGAFRVRNTSLEVDSLFLHGRIPADTLAFGLQRLALSEPRPQVFDVALNARAMLLTNALGRLKVPLNARGRIGLRQTGGCMECDVERLSGRVAHIPLEASGRIVSLRGASDIDARLRVDGASLDTLLREYGKAFLKDAEIVRTDVLLHLSAEAKGRLDSTSFPQTSARLSVPSARLEYVPLGLKAALSLEASASVSEKRRVDASLHDLKIAASGINLDATASARDLAGADPSLQLAATGNADLAQIVQQVPGLSHTEMEGVLDLNARLRSTLSRVRRLEFGEEEVEARFSGGFLRFAIPQDSFSVRTLHPEIVLRSAAGGLIAGAGLDSTYLRWGRKMAVRATSLRNKASVRRLEQDGKPVIRLDFKTDDERVFVRFGPNKAGVRGVKLALAAQQRVRDGGRRKRFLDSLQRIYPGTPRDSLMVSLRREHGLRQLPDYLSEKDFRAYDIRISAGEKALNLLREWSPSGSLSVARGFVATPAFPLRTRFRDIDADFDDRDVHLNSFSLTSGTSDLSARGMLRGLFRTMLGRGVLDLSMDLYSRQINANELLAASTHDEAIPAAAYSDSEDDSAIVTDTLANARVDSLPMAVVPANLRAAVRLKADSLHFAFLDAKPLEAVLNIRERTMQLRDVRLCSPLGDLDLNAYFSTRTKKTMGAGVDMKLTGVSVPLALRLFPGFEQMAPPLKTFEGKVNCEISATTQLDTNMNVMMHTVDGVAKLTGREMKIGDAGNLRLVTSLMLFKNKNIGPLGDISANASIHDSRLDIYPFLLDVDRYQLALSGIYGVGGIMDYYVSILKSPLPIRFGVRVWNGGEGGKMRYALGKARYLDSGIPVYSGVVDSAQVNIASVILNIFQKGVQMARVSARHVTPDSDFEFSASEREKVEQFILDTRQKEEEEAFFGDFDAWMDREIEQDALVLSKKIKKKK